MIRDITIGQYYPADSLLHCLDPRVKFVGTLIYMVSLFMMNSWEYLLGIGFLIGVILLSNVPFSYIIRGLKSIVVLLIITMTLNVLLTPGRVIWQWNIMRVTCEGLELAGRMGVRLICLILSASLMTLTTTLNKLTDAMESLMKPLNKIHVPVHEIAMVMSIALRFIPILLEETDKIMKSQMARGADFDSRGLIKKVNAMIPLLVPLFVSAFRRANDLALAMEARCYNGGNGRTQMKPLRYHKRDWLAYSFLLVYLAASIAIRIVLK